MEARPPDERHPTLQAPGLADVRTFVSARFFSVVGGGVACLAALGVVATRVPRLGRFQVDETPAA